jgi:hypothetical protein
MNDKQANIERINELWKLHEPQDEGLTTEGRCLAFVIDRRYLDSSQGVGMRLGVSFGSPVVGPETEQGFLPIPGQPGSFVFGVHHIGTKGNELTVYDSWLNSLDAGDCTDANDAEKRARSILDSMSDEEYLGLVRESKEDKHQLKVSDMYLLEEFEVVQASAF